MYTAYNTNSGAQALARRRTTNPNQDQFTFDFGFQNTLDTIEALQADVDNDDESGDSYADERTTALGASSQGPESRHTPGGTEFPLIQSSRLENSGSLGIQQPPKVESTGGRGGIDFVGSTPGTTTGRAEGTDASLRSTSIGEHTSRDSVPERDQHRAVESRNYAISSRDSLGEGGAKAKFRDNIAALQLLLKLREEQRSASPAEQTLLVRYVGWGGLPQAFDHRNNDWNAEYLQLSELLTQDEYERARRSTQDAHYTSETVIQGIYEGLQRLGFEGGRVFEPAAGTGNFLGLVPEALKAKTKFTAVELDPLTAEIGKHLYPESTYINKGFQDVVIPTGHFDAVIGNPPFGSQSLYDPQHRELSGFSIHNYFLAKSIDKLREGGVMAQVVSRYFLDANSTTARSYIADKAHFLGAIRLPNSAFKRNALTEVTTDIVFFRKAAADEQTDKSWVNVGEIHDRETGTPITINQYYIQNPQQLAGKMVLTRNMHRETAELVPEPGKDLGQAIRDRLEILPPGGYTPARRTEQASANKLDKPTLILPTTLKVGSFFVAPNGSLARRLPDMLDQHDYVGVLLKNERAGERIKSMILVRDTLRELMQSEQSEDSTDVDLNEKRQRLNLLYDQSIRKFGHISAQANKLAMIEDPMYPLMHALESDYDKGITPETAKKHDVDPRPPSAKKAAIFSKRVMSPRTQVTKVESAKDALVVSMNETGRIDLSRMVRLSGKPESELIEDLKGLMYRNPLMQRWETADQYLSGNVKDKLSAATAAANLEPRFLENVEALRAVQPADIEPVDISVQLGSTWVPDLDVEEFARHLLGRVACRVTYQPTLGKYLAKIGPSDRTTGNVTWGTERYPANQLVEAILLGHAIQVKDEIGTDERGNKIYRINDAQTASANQKADEIRQAFVEWIWHDKDRRERLARVYNDRFNTNVPARYDGSHLQLPGASLDITLRPHQKDAIWRGIQDGTALFDHVVGAGKTLVAVGTVMESKRMGLMNKPMIVVPNHLLLQWKDAFYSLYPNANILIAEKADFKKENREKLFGRIATGDWDAVIVAHSSFKRIGMPEATLSEILNEQINDLSQAVRQLREENGDRITIKEMEKARERMQERLERKADTGSKDQAVSFSDLGVDAIVVDEAHEFKNLYITTSLSRISGLGNLAGSEKAFDLFVKARYLQKMNDGRGVFFATGTPISNTIAELYTMQRYMQYDELKARGVVHFDAWASTFGQVVSGWELDATGVNYKLNSRFSRFQNVPELVTQYRTFADVITKADLDRQAEERGTRFPVPKIKGGKPLNIVVERSFDQANFMGVQTVLKDSDGLNVHRADGLLMKAWNEGSIIHRMENLPKDPRIDNPLKITNEARKAGLDFRLIDPNADDHPDSKINVAIDNIYRIWAAWDERKGTQLVFCDLSTPKQKKAPVQPLTTNSDDADDDLPVVSMDELLASGSAFSVYDDIRTKLLERGVPEHEIRFIHEAGTDLQKSKLFDEMNRGQVRIMLGSTAKMGAGTNVQRRLVAEHHLDAPWRPSDLEQREGRILRQGNLFYEQDPDGFEVEILRYATKQTYDSRMWQTIEYKAAGIEQFRRGDSLQRIIEDVAGEAANAAEMKAAATGNPLIFMQVKLSAELKKIEAIYANHKRAKHSLDSRLDWLAGSGARADRAVARCNAEIQLRDSSTREGFSMVINGKAYNEEQREQALGHVMSSMKRAIDSRPKTLSESPALVPVGTYRGFEVEVYARRDHLQFSLSGADSYEPENLSYSAEDKFSLTGFTNRVDNFLAKFPAWRDEAETLRSKEALEQAHAIREKDKPFPHQEKLETLRNDARDVMTELKLMQADDNYVSNWQPQSFARATTEEKNLLQTRMRL
ncbi:DEAD/DEAH box helicase family protein [Pseudomonas sp. AB12(2023)]|uniref:Eco57I restriction-modification methylase domain-containing protein n=1 Tax=Pseudomonas sp. AB12(2023) TaxID=3048597 RepID=UPI002B23A276|nr:DEAD/DEAH box helicase family protein [Pseudomonas sp. AB12(2023)]MEB0221359.1 DEAD/DEAH box helicase family protein [Pseudomonas sp. AB12(2023)]